MARFFVMNHVLNESKKKREIEMFKKFAFLFLFALLAFTFSPVAMAQHGGHSHGGTTAPSPQTDKSHDMGMKSSPTQSVTVEGFKVSLEVMDRSAHMSMPGMKGSPQHGESHSQSHSLMVTLQDTASKEIITDARVSFSIVSPAGKKENGKMDWSGDHYAAGFSPREKGTYQVELKIESGGMERDAKLSYEFN
jgi:hypothetical protein